MFKNHDFVKNYFLLGVDVKIFTQHLMRNVKKQNIIKVSIIIIIKK